MNERLYVWIVFDVKTNSVIGIFRDKTEAEKYGKQYSTAYKIEYHVVN